MWHVINDCQTNLKITKTKTKIVREVVVPTTITATAKKKAEDFSVSAFNRKDLNKYLKKIAK